MRLSSDNQAQFERRPSQSRHRLIGGRHPAPPVLRPCLERYDKVTGVRYEEDPDDGEVVRAVDVPARTSALSPPDAPAFRRALRIVPVAVAHRLRAHLAPVRGVAPTLLATESHAPGLLRDPWPRLHRATNAADATVRAVLGGVDPATPVEDSVGTPVGEVVRAVLAREAHCCVSSRGVSRYYRRRVTLREALCVMTVAEPGDTSVGKIAATLEQTRPLGTTVNQWRACILHGLGNGVPVVMAEAFGRAAMVVPPTVRRKNRLGPPPLDTPPDTLDTLDSTHHSTLHSTPHRSTPHSTRHPTRAPTGASRPAPVSQVRQYPRRAVGGGRTVFEPTGPAGPFHGGGCCPLVDPPDAATTRALPDPLWRAYKRSKVQQGRERKKRIA